MKDNQQLSRKELYNYDEKLKSDFLELFLNYSKGQQPGPKGRGLQKPS